MDSAMRRSIIIGVGALVAGFILGLVWGWVIAPVEWTGAGPQDLAPAARDQYIYNVADLYSQDLNQGRVLQSLELWDDANATICWLAANEADTAAQDRLLAIAAIKSGNNSGCGDIAVLAGAERPVPAGPASGGSSNVILFCVAALVLLAIFGGLIWVMMQRSRANSSPDFDDFGDGAGDSGGADVALVDDDSVGSQAIARFRTSFSRGNDNYDDSFPIENANGDFLGECGVGISESIGTDMPRNVTAFEVWLFDKNDIRTITKVVMSDHAFFDDAIKAKLSPKGEPVLARLNEVVALETASLIINAEIVELEYGDNAGLPAESFFERFTIELSAWTKEGGGSDGNAIDDALNY